MGAYYPETVQCSQADFQRNRCGLPAGPASSSGPGAATATPRVRCPAAAGQIAGLSLGPARLGVSRTRQRIALPGYRTMANRRFDHLCLRAGPGIRIGYLAARRGAAPTAVLAMTADSHFAFRHIRAGATLQRALRTLGSRVSGPWHRGPNRWYAASGPGRPASTSLLQVRGAKVTEIGIASRRLSDDAAKLRHLLSVLNA